MKTVATPPPDAATRMAVDRTRLAYERTMMAWVRTATSLISFGFTIYKFFQFRIERGDVLPQRLLGPSEFGGLMILTGLLALLMATWDHRRSMNRMRAEYGPMPGSTAAAVGGLIAALGVIALVTMVVGI